MPLNYKTISSIRMASIDPIILENFQDIRKQSLVRLEKEYNRFSESYTVTLEKNTFIVNIPFETITYTLRIIIPTKYPFDQPFIRVESPFMYVIPDIKTNWGPGMVLINFVVSHVKSKIDAINQLISTMKPILTPMIESIPDTAYLVLGSFPSENKRGRYYYTNPSIYLLDQMNVDGNFPNYFRIDFTNSEQLLAFSSLVGKKFDEICFDYSTMKFFKIPQDSVVERITYLKNMLKDTGTLYFESIGSPPGGAYGVNKATGQRIVNDDRGIFIEECKEAGLSTDVEMRAEDITDSVLVNELYGKSDVPGTKNPTILISKKLVSGGKRCKIRKIQRKTYKKHKTTKARKTTKTTKTTNTTNTVNPSYRRKTT
jgi:hypothetical protein